MMTTTFATRCVGRSISHHLQSSATFSRFLSPSQVRGALHLKQTIVDNLIEATPTPTPLIGDGAGASSKAQNFEDVALVGDLPFIRERPPHPICECAAASYLALFALGKKKAAVRARRLHRT